MNHLITSLMLLGISHTSFSQMPLPLPVPVDASKSKPVASPNRVTAEALSRSAESRRNNQHSNDSDHKWAHGTRRSATWVDSTGKTLGREIYGGNAIVPYKGQLAYFTGLVANFSCIEGGNNCTHKGGSVWSTRTQVSYTTPNCTGTAYLDLIFGGTPYAGSPILENGSIYLYIVREVDVASITRRSIFFNGQCQSFDEGFVSPLAPVISVEPEATFGTPPYYLK